MLEITIFLLGLIGVLIPANAVLWLTEKRNKKEKPGFETTFLRNPKTNALQNTEIQVIQEQLMQLNEYIRKNNGLLIETKKFKNMHESIYSKINALEEAITQIQNELNEIKDFKNVELFSQKKEKTPESNRVKILEEYLKKI